MKKGQVPAINGPIAANLSAALLIVVTVLMSLAFLWLLNNYRLELIEREKHQAFIRVSAYSAALSSATSTRVTLMQGLKTFFDERPDELTAAKDFAGFANLIYKSAAGIQIVAYAPKGVVTYFQPEQGNEPARGHNLLADDRPALRKYVSLALTTRSMTFGSPYEMRQGGFGAFLRQPLYNGDAFRGFVVLGFAIYPLLQEANIEASIDGFGIAIKDQDGNLIFGDGRVFQSEPVVLKTNLVGPTRGEWEIAAAPLTGWSSTVVEGLLLPSLFGIIILILFSLIGYRELRVKGELENEVKLRTAELQQEKNAAVENLAKLAQLHILAGSVQRSFLPTPLENEFLTISHFYQPIEELSGDSLDYVWDEGRRCGVGFIADVCGHGLAPSLQTTAIHVLLKELWLNSDNMSENLIKINKEALPYFGDDSFVAAICFELDAKSGLLQVVAAGINKFLLFSGNRRGVVKIPGSLLGISASPEFDTQIIPVQKGDFVCFLSDGLFDLIDPSRLASITDYEQLLDWLEKLSLSEVRRDDVSAICIRLNG